MLQVLENHCFLLSFHDNVDEMLWEFNSCVPQLACGKPVLLSCFA